MGSEHQSEWEAVLSDDGYLYALNNSRDVGDDVARAMDEEKRPQLFFEICEVENCFGAYAYLADVRRLALEVVREEGRRLA
jgi:hypothetical protein